MADPPQFFYTPTSSIDETYNRSSSIDSTDSRSSTDYYTQRSPNGNVLRHRLNLPNDYYAQNIDRDTEYKKSLTTRKVIQRIDFFPKVDRDLTVRTEHGANNTRLGILFVIILVIAEYWSWSASNKRLIEHVVVDTSLGKKMRVDLNITFPALHCQDLHIDLMDIAGDVHNDVEETMVKKRLTLDGRYLAAEEILIATNAAHEKDRQKQATLEKGMNEDYCGPCYGASDDPEHCCKSCEDVINLYHAKGWDAVTIRMLAEQCVREGKNEPKRMSKGEGCNIAGHMVFNRVSGNFHIAMGEGVERDGNHIHTFQPDDSPNFNASHIIHELRFGPTYGIGDSVDLQGLNGVTKIVTEEDGTTGLFQYFIKIVPTTYKGAELVKSLSPNHRPEENNMEPILETNRYFTMERFRPLILDIDDENYDIASSVHGSGTDIAGARVGGGKANHHHHHKVTQAILPGVFFIYQIYPFAIEVTRESVPLTHLLVRMMAAVGGVFTLLKVYDGLQSRINGKR